MQSQGRWWLTTKLDIQPLLDHRRSGYVAAQQMPGSEVWLSAALWGLALGLSASGLYSGAKRVVEG